MDPPNKPANWGEPANPQDRPNSQWKAYWNGGFVPPADIGLSIFDAGFIQGTTVAEQLRTFGGKPFRVAEHVQRLRRSLEIVGVSPTQSDEEFADIIQQVAERNFPLIDPEDDLAIGLWITPGPAAKFAADESLGLRSGANVCCYARPLDFQNWPGLHENGQSLITSDIRQVTALNWPAELKCRSRMHYHLADQRAQAKDPTASGLLLDSDGFANETSKANVLAVIEGEGIVSPRREKILPGITLGVIEELAEQLETPITFRDIMPFELVTAKEVLLCSTAACVWAATKIDGEKIGDGEPGPICNQLLAEFGFLTGKKIADQAAKFESR